MPLWLFSILIVIWLALIPTAYAGLIGAPYAPTRLPVVRKAFKQLGIGEGDVVVDLGAGDGQILLEATGQGATAIGYELSPIMWLVSWWRLRCRQKPFCTRRRCTTGCSHIYYKNFYRQKLPPDTTVVFAFLMPRIMPKVVHYLKKQDLPHGKYFLAYTFPLPQDINPITIIRENKCGPIYVYDLRELVTGNK